MQDYVFEDDDGVVDDQPYGSSEAAESHEIEALTCHFQNDESDEQGYGYHQSRHQRSSPIAQEQDENDGREHNSNEHGIAHAGDGVVHDCGLIVKRLEMNARRQSRSEFLDESMYFVCDIQGVAFGLAIHIEKHSRLAVCGHHGVNRGDGRRDIRDVAQAYGNAG